MNSSSLDKHVNIVVEMDGLLLAEVVAALVQHGLFRINDRILIGLVSALLSLEFSYFLIKREHSDSDVVLGMRSQVYFTYFERRRAVRGDESCSKTHSFVAVQVDVELHVVHLLLQDCLNLRNTYATTKDFNLMDVARSKASFRESLLDWLFDALV